MKITIIGTGYVGLVTGACLAELGNEVLCLDLDTNKVALLNKGGLPIYEPGLELIVSRNQSIGRLQFTTDVAKSVAHGEVQFIAVGTPPDEDGSADLQYVLAAAKNIGTYMQGFKVVIEKSTVPVGTAEKVSKVIAAELTRRNAKECSFSVVSNPEFLKEGAAVEDFMHPDRIVVGCDSDEPGKRARTAMTQLYAAFNNNRDSIQERIHWMDVRSAEFTKYAANAMLATRISFMNELANLADCVGVDIEAVRHGIGSDPRIGPHFLHAGCGYGGSCFPKDVKALERTAREYNQDLLILCAVETVNDNQKQLLGKKIVARFGENLKGHHFALWGLAFKPNTDDMRAASSRVLLRELVMRGATVAVHDPVAMTEARRVLALDFADEPQQLQRISFVNNPLDAAENADALLVVTEWKDYRRFDVSQLKSALKNPIIFDGRNLFNPNDMQDLGIEYHGIGRSVLTKSICE